MVKRLRERGLVVEIIFPSQNRGDAAFHVRYTIGKNSYYNISTSLSDPGGGRDADVIRIPLRATENAVETAFNYWVDLPRKTLFSRGIRRKTSSPLNNLDFKRQFKMGNF